MPSKTANTPPKKAARKTSVKTSAKASAAKTVTKASPKKLKTPPKTTKTRASKAQTSKTQAPKTQTAKTQTAKTPASRRQTVTTLAQDLKSLESRLKGADTKNRNALKSLKSVVTDLETSTQSSNTKLKAAMTRGLTSLEARMETYLARATEQARAGVRQDLAAVTAPKAGIDTLNQAVQSAHARLDQVDAAQRESIARLNRHLADIATSVETRLTAESNARQAAAAALDTKIDKVQDTVNTRIDRVEVETADALESIGGKVAEFAAVLEQRSHASDADTAERLADLAQETQTEFNHVQTDMTTRLEALETIAASWSPSNHIIPANVNVEDPRVDQMAQTVFALQEELRRMHARVAVLQDTDIRPASPQGVTNVVAMPTARAPQNAVPLASAAPHLMDNPYAEAARALEASSAEVTPDLPVATPPYVPAQDQTPPAPNPPAAKKGPSHFPEEFDPNAYQASPPPYDSIKDSPPINYGGLGAPAAPYTPPVAPAAPIAPPPVAPPAASSAPYTANPSNASVIEPVMPAPLPVSTYSDPAYAEGPDYADGTEMRAERIGGESRRGPSLPKLPITARNLRVGGLAVGLAVIGLVTAKTVLGSPEGPDLQARSDVSTQAPIPENQRQGPINSIDAMLSPAASTEPTAPIAPLGQYAETRTPDLAPGTLDTLDKAVAAGNPIAQFQKGLVQLQIGQAENGARLIRLAANRNQPAAQYRLAKLYETGTGVTKDLITARELVERAAQGGNRIAMHDLANYYAYGQGGLDRDMGQALNWFVKAAERGVVDSQFNVAFLREGNEGVPADAETALFWYYIAARQGDQGAPERISALTAQMDDKTQAAVKSRADKFNPKPVDEAANGIFRNVAWSKPAKKAAPALSAQILQIRDAQTMLSDLGYQVGTPDGAAGPKTKAAIKQFEKVNGLPETGKITDDLIERLEAAVGA